MQPFIKMLKSQKTIELMKDPKVFMLLVQIAYRAKRTDDFNIHGLEVGEALIGDYQSIGLTRGQYRAAIKRATKYHQISTIRTTNAGTVVKLINSDIFDINVSTQQPTPQPSNNHPTTTNKKYKNDKNIKHTNLSKLSIEPTKSTKKIKVAFPSDFELTESLIQFAITNQINPKKINSFFELFRDKAQANNYKYSNWCSAFRNFVRKAPEYNPEFCVKETQKTLTDEERWLQTIKK